MIDYFLDFANLEEELRNLTGDSNLCLRHFNKGKTNDLKKHFEPHLSEIKELYQEDYELYNKHLIGKEK